ncbi:Canalicular multispecific organic anion transporter 1 [Ceratocystis fimbriata CBS 114723]|uniref:Canalicular multispecific organic anion transporter 1 n=1 Tax=Ceratocystis fimbriata CBS 114723 TaxID=1035309 RepID=A0A2C5XGB1_9PEZI|nr:Canalicular multispecific organic anion transporter 1 [Ceratocystis fimbriata CBS 114723]
MSGFSDSLLAWALRSSSSQRVLHSGSISGFHPLAPVSHGYMTSAASSSGGLLRRPFCGNAEGWGPLSPVRYDFTPCFIDVSVMSVALFGVFIGALAVAWLLKRPQTPGVVKDWHFWMKQTILAGIIGVSISQVVLQAISYGKSWYLDFRTWTSAVNIVALCVVFYIQWLEHPRMRNPNGVVLFYWLFLLIVLAIKLRSLISQQVYSDAPAFFILYCVGLGLCAIEFFFEWLWPRKHSSYEVLIDEEECPLEYADVFSVLTFGWMTPLMRYGYKEYLTEDDLWALARDDNTNTTGALFMKAWDHELKTKARPNLWLVLLRAYGGPYMLGAIFKIGNDVAQYMQPQLLRILIGFVASYSRKNDGEPEPVIKGAAVALGMFAVAVFQTAMVHQYFQRAFVCGMRIKGGLTSAIYKKSMKLSNEGRSSKTTGDIVNYMAVDAQRMQDLTQFGQMLWSAPFQIIICMWSLYDLVGWSMLAGIAVMIVMLPINGVISKIMRNLQKEQMKVKDSRSRLITEIINNMKSIKLYAWGTAFMNKLNHVRNDQELKNLRKIGATQALANFTWNTAPFFVSCSTFAVFVFTHDQPLSTDIVFPALALFNLLNFPLAILPMVITAIVEASVAVGRITDFLVADELQSDAVIVGPAPTAMGEETVIISDGVFSWDRHQDKDVLTDIDYTAYKGELSCIVGRVGAGKSSFLQAMLGDLYKSRGKVEVRGTIAYVAQQAWILNATVKDNIVFGYRYDADFYDRTIRACALLDDFAQLPDGDETYVGERGISLSGGQKARVALARAVYARADIYLLDDVLSAVDSHVGKHIIDNVLGPRGLLETKTRILATNSIPVLREATHITLLRDGRITEAGTFKQLMAMKGAVSDLLKTAGHESSNTNSETSTIAFTDNGKSRANSDVDEADEDVPEMKPINSKSNSNAKAKDKVRSDSITTLRRASAASFRSPRGKIVDEEGSPAKKTSQSKESSEKGNVKLKVYMEYARSNNLVAVAMYMVTLVLAQVANIGGSVWLKKWSESNAENGYNAAIGRFLGIYFVFGVGSSALTMVQTLVLWIFCSIEASRKLHEKMATAIFRAPMSFFDVTPTGRILNRFSSDIYKIDELLARTFNMLFVNGARSVFTLVIISISTPAFMLLILPLTFMYMYIQKYYLRTSRELKRLNSVSRSPVYAHFQETLGGTATIRAYGKQSRFEQDNEWRVDANLRAFFPSISSNRWLAIRLEFIGALVILAAAGFSIISVTSGSELSAGMVGLAMAYALQIVTSLNWIVRQSVEVETNIVSVERVLEYAAIKSEAPEIIPDHRPPAAWPTKGAVEFNNYSTRYRDGLDLVLKDITLDIKSHEKIGVVGRTGAGKSSLTLALFRIIEAASGNISLDNINTSSVGLLDLRRRLAIIPQDAALFEGTVRDNLDPGHVHDDSELWSVLEHARLKDHVVSMTGQLDARIQEAGANLSQGQRQLISLARAMLTPSNILVLDEATAAVDVETDALLQETLRSPIFSHRTIITVAHRINTIIDSDRVVVLDKGRVAEFGTPADLLKDTQGVFYGLVKQAGLLEGEQGGSSSTEGL